jgi:hypothetical protein
MKAFLNVGLLLIIAIALGIANYRTGGLELFKLGMGKSGKFFLQILPLIGIYALLSGQVEAYYSKKPGAVGSAIEGKNGIVAAAVLGAAIPGGMAAGPILQEEWKTPGNRYAVIAFVLSMLLINWSTAMIRLPFFGEKISIWIYCAGMAITALAVVALTMIKATR